MTLETLDFEKLPIYKPDYEHVHCGCGGIIWLYDRYHNACLCDVCGRGFKLSDISYDYLKINDKTGWIFPVIMRRGK